MSQVVVGVDFGSSRIKAAAFTRDGEMVAVGAVNTPLVRASAGDDFPVLEMLDAARHVVAALDVDDIAALGMTSMGEVGTILTHDGLAPIAFPSWYDDRGDEVVHALERGWGARRLRDLTARHLRTTSTVAKLAHVQATTSGVPAGRFVGLCGALAHQLTGQTWQEAGLAVTSGVYDLVERRYLSDVWASAGLAHVGLVDIRPPGRGAPAQGDLARALKLTPGAPVIIAGHDHPVAAVGSGVRVGEAFDSLGTGEAIIAPFSRDAGVERGDLVAHLDRDPDLTFEVWPSTGAPLVVWERMRPGLAMRTFLDASALDRGALEDGALPPGDRPSFSPDDLAALQSGRLAPGRYDAPAWGDLIDAYVLLASQGDRLVREVSGARGATIVTGGGLRSRRWRGSKLALHPGPLEVSTVTEAAARGCAAIAGVSAGWWSRPENMPGTTRIPVSTPAEMDAALEGPASPR
ncbi:FGGY family carbohydrate kinase [Microbacterium sp. Kw_RZR3]|uniref:FGGY family carbohydrate kinase n=1 Tax=Microbacterium sp. Kw_RZR3 TaxID=3032903 RepID=UPI0023DBDEB2|nr:FGGY family carbohydrate kinase [Microbacterium sp. Kw_RZR3]MDF2046445.1 FGGY family carbohydrate kinase [Microbacterium sp. Kw_RZR3]